jgi:hypothetical protein
MMRMTPLGMALAYTASEFFAIDEDGPTCPSFLTILQQASHLKFSISWETLPEEHLESPLPPVDKAT